MSPQRTSTKPCDSKYRQIQRGQCLLEVMLGSWCYAVTETRWEIYCDPFSLGVPVLCQKNKRLKHMFFKFLISTLKAELEELAWLGRQKGPLYWNLSALKHHCCSRFFFIYYISIALVINSIKYWSPNLTAVRLLLVPFFQLIQILV